MAEVKARMSGELFAMEAAYPSDPIKMCFTRIRQASRGLRRTSMISQTSEQRALLTFCAAFAKCPKDGEGLGEIILFEDQPQAASACACNQHLIRDAGFFSNASRCM